MIEIRNLTFGYDARFKVFLDFNLKFESGKNYLLYSAQGLESSCLFRMMTNQDRDYKGEILFNDVNVKNIVMKNLDICYTTSTPYLFSHKSIKENICYPLRLRKMKKNEIEKRFNLLVEKYEISDMLNLKIKALSQYQKILVTIFRAIIQDKSIWLIDDILTWLNEPERQKILDIINSSDKQKIMATQNINFYNQLENFEKVPLSSIN